MYFLQVISIKAVTFIFAVCSRMVVYSIYHGWFAIYRLHSNASIGLVPWCWHFQLRTRGWALRSNSSVCDHFFGGHGSVRTTLCSLLSQAQAQGAHCTGIPFAAFSIDFLTPGRKIACCPELPCGSLMAVALQLFFPSQCLQEGTQPLLALGKCGCPGQDVGSLRVWAPAVSISPSQSLCFICYKLHC